MSKIRFLSFKLPEKYDGIIQVCVFILAAFGTLMIASASMGEVNGNAIALAKVVLKQLAYILIGYFALSFMARYFDMKNLKRFIGLATVAIGIMLLMCLVFTAVNGAKAWIHIPLPGIEVTIQPSEFAKVCMICLMANYLGDISSGKEINYGFKTVLLALAIYAFVIWRMQHDFGSMAVLVAISLVVFLIPRNRWLRKYQRFIFMMILVGFAGLVLIMNPAGNYILERLPIMQYQISRFTSAMNPFADRYGAGYQLIAGLVAFAKGGLTGVGYGNSFQKYTNFPEATSDFILTIVVEETGMIGFMLIFICYALIIFQCFRYAARIRNEKARMILVGVAMYIFVHYLLNVGGVTCLIPLTGVPLLMISAGGTSTMSFLMSIGIVQAIISRYRRGLLE